jgi:serine/threonine protein kinase
MSASWGPGTVIVGRYRLESLLGRGGMGSVWQAEHVQLRSPVAIKLLDETISRNPQVLTRFMREAQAAALLRSPHVVQTFDFGVEDGTAFIAMELLRGESLAERIARLGHLPPEEVILFLSQVLRAIAKAHDAGIVHRDLKPANIFICKEEPEFAKVLDFGVAKVVAGELAATAGGRTQPGVMIGTPYYMSPEQMKARDVDARADLWSIAVIAYECIVGVRPFTGEELGELVLAICTGPVPVPSTQAAVPAGFDEWFVKATQRDRNRRFASAREMADELIELSSLAGPLRPQFSTVRNLAAIASMIPQRKAPSSRAAAADKWDLTTGQRAATSKSFEQARPPLGFAAYAMIGAAAMIVLGVAAFVISGRASAFKSVVTPNPAAASLTTATPVSAVASQSPVVASAPTPSALASSSAGSAAAAASAGAEPAPVIEAKRAVQPVLGPGKPKAHPTPQSDTSEFGLRR